MLENEIKKGFNYKSLISFYNIIILKDHKESN